MSPKVQVLTEYRLHPVEPGRTMTAVISQEGLTDERWRVVAVDKQGEPWVVCRDELIPIAALFGGWTALLSEGKAWVEDESSEHHQRT